MIPRFAVLGAAPARRPTERLSGWTEDLARSMNASDLARLAGAVDDTLTSVADAYDTLNKTETELDDLGNRISEVQGAFGSPDPSDPESPASIAIEPLQVAEAHIRVAARRMAGIDILFYELSLVYTDIGNTFASAGFTSEAGSARLAAQSMRDWRAAVDSRIYPRVSSALDARATLDDAFKVALAARGLRPVQDNDKAGYFEALREVLSPLGEEPTEGALLQGASLGADPVSVALLITAIVKVVVIGAVIIGALLIINRIVENVFGAGNQAMKAATELQTRKTLREQAVQQGTMTRDEADRANAEDSRAFKEEVTAASVAAAHAGPSATDLLLWVGIPVAGLGAVLGILKVSGVI